ncbi:restriction endonuclease subunit S, partial [Arcobacteraceae bacterium]|nr:restriction endonuclease subunit S [Arcobacteraceae bacterium]
TEHALVVTPVNGIDKNWLDYQLKEMNLNQYATGTAQPGLSVKNLVNIVVGVPSLEIQKKLVNKIEIIEDKIQENEKELKSIPLKKEEILNKYLT